AAVRGKRRWGPKCRVLVRAPLAGIRVHYRGRHVGVGIQGHPRLSHAEWAEDLLLKRSRKWLARDLAQDHAKKEIVGVRECPALTRREQERQVGSQPDHRDRRVTAVWIGRERMDERLRRHIVLVTRGVGRQHSERHLPRVREPWEPP